MDGRIFFFMSKSIEAEALMGAVYLSGGSLIVLGWLAIPAATMLIISIQKNCCTIHDKI